MDDLGVFCHLMDIQFLRVDLSKEALPGLRK